MPSAAFGIAHVVDAVVASGSAAAGQACKAGLLIFGVLFTFQLIEGAAELATSPSSCRLWSAKFWLRILLVAGGLAGYQTVVTGTVAQLQPTFMTSFAGNWATVWESEMTAIEGIKKAEAENQDLKGTEVTATKAGKDDDSWYSKLGKYVVDALLTGLGWVLAVIAGLVITVFILMEGFTGLGMNMLLVAVGPICVAFAAHEKTESYFWGFLKAFLFVGLLYMPLLGLTCQFAGVIMAQMTTMVTGSGLVYGDGSDISIHFLFVVLGPFCAFAVVRSAPMFLGMVLGTGGGGGGGGAAFAMGAAVGRQAGGAAAGGAGGAGEGGGAVSAGGGGGVGAVGVLAGPATGGSGAEGGGSSGDGPGSVADLRGE
jgi:hypothetical protein